jgi:hypothetical protein
MNLNGTENRLLMATVVCLCTLAQNLVWKFGPVLKGQPITQLAKSTFGDLTCMVTPDTSNFVRKGSNPHSKFPASNFRFHQVQAFSQI